MKKEDKELLLKDLCARLPYNVKVRGIFFNYNKVKDKVLYEECDRLLTFDNLRNKSIKPYLRPLSSMTNEEKKYLVDLELEYKGKYNKADYYLLYFDWLNAHHFDYRGLIEKGLALEAPKGMYDFK